MRSKYFMAIQAFNLSSSLELKAKFLPLMFMIGTLTVIHLL